jgi:hypothetical protein
LASFDFLRSVILATTTPAAVSACTPIDINIVSIYIVWRDTWDTPDDSPYAHRCTFLYTAHLFTHVEFAFAPMMNQVGVKSDRM